MTRPGLRLVRDETDAQTRERSGAAASPPSSYKFPGGVREVLGRPDPRRMSADEVAALADRSIRQMQAQLDLLRQEACLLAEADAGCCATISADLPDRAA